MTKEISKKPLFHGTAEKIKGPLRGGGYDGILWTAEDSTIAQNYIPVAGSTLYFKEIDSCEIKESVKPYDIDLKLGEQMGYKAMIYSEKYGRPNSWSWFKGKKSVHLKKGELKEYIEDFLGYKAKNGLYKLRMERGKIMPSEYKIQGELYIMTLKEGQEIKLFDYRLGNEGDLQNPQYNHLSAFEKIKISGYDGVIINDFAQSNNWGNLGHKSIGLFPSGIDKMEYVSIPATNFDFGDSLRVFHTPEYSAYAIRENLENIKGVFL